MLNEPLNYLRRRWSDLHLRTKGMVVLALPLLAFGLNYAITGVLLAEQAEAQRLVSHTLDVRISIGQILAERLQIGAALEVYRAAKANQYLRDAGRAKADLARAITTFQQLTTDNPRQQARIRKLERDVAISEDSSFSSFQQLARDLDDMDAEEVSLEVGRLQRLKASGRWVSAARLTLLILAVCGCLAAIWLFSTGIERRVVFIKNQVALLAGGRALDCPDPHRDEIGQVSKGLLTASRLLLEKQTGLENANSALRESVENVRRSEAQFRQLADSMPQIVWIADSNGSIYYYNERWYEFTGFDRSLTGDQSWRPLLHPDDLQGVVDAWHSAVHSGAPYEKDMRLWNRAAQTYQWQLTRAVAIKNEEGAVVKWFGSSLDIDDYKQAKSRAEDANRLKSEFLSSMSHEIRTPMNAILGMADLLWETELDPTQRQYVGVFRRAGANLLTLINDILDLSKIESGHFELERIEFDLEDLLERTYEIVRSKAHAKRIALISRLAPGTPASFLGDPTRLQQILINLLGNAVKFTEAGEVKLSVAPDASEPGRLHFEVADSGIGIAADKLESIFDDFTQAESSTTRTFGGTGLGLGICRRLVERMGGRLNVRSALGKGSVFYFDALFTTCAQSEHYAPERGIELAGRRVLIVDNSSTNRLIFAEMCRAWGMLPSECASADAVLATLQSAERNHEAFDLIIVDRLMHGVDGFELAARIRHHFTATPILMTTSDYVPGDLTRGRQVGIDEYAVKPVRRSEMRRLICKLLGSADTHQHERSAKPNVVAAEARVAATLRILIADDSEDNRFLLREYLKNSRHEVAFAENGMVAFQAAGSAPFDLIVMDVQMPVMDGLTAARRIRMAEREEGRDRVPMLALTADARKEDIEASRVAGCDAHLSKPITREKLLLAIEEFGAGKHPRPSSPPREALSL